MDRLHVPGVAVGVQHEGHEHTTGFGVTNVDHPLPSFFFASDAITHRVAAGHFVIDERPVVSREWALPRAAHPAGGITSTVKDQLRYARFQLEDGRGPDGAPLLSPESLAFMRTSVDDLAARMEVILKGGFPTAASPLPPTPPPMRLGFADKDRIMILDGPMKGGRGEFIRKPDGSIGWLRVSRLRARQA